MGGAPQQRGVEFGLSPGWVALACVIPAALACVAPVALVDGRWRAAASGASVVDLAELEPGWRRTSFEGPLLAFEAADGAHASWLRRCPGSTASSRAEGHALLIALEAVEVRHEEPVSLGGREAWILEASAREAGRPVRLKSVTRAAGGCTDDFLLVTSADPAAHEGAFDRWWASYQSGRPD
jgi:hypothetical protein